MPAAPAGDAGKVADDGAVLAVLVSWCSTRPVQSIRTGWQTEEIPDMITFHVDRGDSVPAYAQLIRQVREALRMGLLRPGDQLPTVRSVVTSCTVNPSTVLRAYRELELAGLVEARQGAGTYVSGTLGDADPHVMARLRSGLARWLGQAREAGLEDEDVQALFASVIAEDSLRRAQADNGPPRTEPVARAAFGKKGDAA
jgi:GntR family transcriptional regulator